MRLAIAFISVYCLASSTAAQTFATDSLTQERVLIGPVARSAFQDSSWFRSNYNLYIPSAGLISRIDSSATRDSVAVVFGSWCSDSHMWVPMFLRIADSSSLSGHISFTAVPRSTGWRDQLTHGLNIEKEPTFIFYHDGKEIGRIVEEPRGDLGEDIVKILRGKK